jgi:hypothetical protein
MIVMLPFYKLLLPSNWFFSKPEKSTKVEEKLHYRRRTMSEPTDAAEEDEDKESNKGSLSKLVSRHFSATTDIRAFNINMPQSQ